LSFFIEEEVLGALLGMLLGNPLGESLGILLGESLGILLGESLGILLGESLGILLGESLGTGLSSSVSGGSHRKKLFIPIELEDATVLTDEVSQETTWFVPGLLSLL